MWSRGTSQRLPWNIYSKRLQAIGNPGQQGNRRRPVNSGAVFGLSVLMGFVAFAIVTKIYLLPPLRVMRREHALTALLIPNIFRFIGLCFLVPGVVAASLPRAFAAPAAYGDLIAAILAAIATLALYGGRSWAIPVVWVFNVWGTLDLLLGFYQGEIGARIVT